MPLDEILLNRFDVSGLLDHSFPTMTNNEFQFPRVGIPLDHIFYSHQIFQTQNRIVHQTCPFQARTIRLKHQQRIPSLIRYFGFHGSICFWKEALPSVAAPWQFLFAEPREVDLSAEMHNQWESIPLLLCKKVQQLLLSTQKWTTRSCLHKAETFSVDEGKLLACCHLLLEIQNR